MATRKPIVIVDGQLRQIASGDILEASLNEVDFVTVTNKELVDDLVVGTPVYASGADQVKKALADSLTTSEVVGLATETIAADAAGRVLTDGRLTATAAEWDAITGDVGGLTFGTVYFLDPTTAGQLTSIAPTVDGDVVIRVGKAIGITVMEVSIGLTVLL